MTQDRTDIVRVLHPAPMLVRRKHARTRELAFVLRETPLTLRQVDPELIGEPLRAHVPGVEGSLRWHVLEGRLWYRLRCVSLDPSRPSPLRSFGPKQFETFLGTGLMWEAMDHTDIGACFLRTPLIAASMNLKPPTRGKEWGGTGLGGLWFPVSEVIRDGRDDAVPTLLAFMERSVVIAGDAVLVRTADPLATFEMGAPVLQPFPRLKGVSSLVPSDDPLGYALDALDDAYRWDREARRSAVLRHHPRDPRIVALGEIDPGSETALLVANMTAAAAHEAFQEMSSPRGGHLDEARPAEVEAFLAMGAEISGWGEKAALGTIGEDDACRVVALAADAAKAMRELCVLPRYVQPASIGLVERGVKRFGFEWSRVAPPTVPDADVEALAGLTG